MCTKTTVQASEHVSNGNVTITSCMQVQIKPKSDDSTETLTYAEYVHCTHRGLGDGELLIRVHSTFLARMLGFRPVAVRDAEEHTTREGW